MTEETMKLTEGFLRCLAGECSGCMRRGFACQSCYCRTAGLIVRRIDSESPREEVREDPLALRVRRILEILAAAGRPLSSGEIDVSDLCSKQLKFWTLNRMANHGTIVRRFLSDSGTSRFAYSLPETKNKEI